MTGSRHHPTSRLPLGLDHLRRAALPLVVQSRRQGRGLSRSTIAELTGATVQDVIDLETGAALPSLEMLFALADALGTDAAELLHETRTLAEDMIVRRWLARRRNAPVSGLAPFFTTRGRQGQQVVS